MERPCLPQAFPHSSPPLECATFILYFASDQDHGILTLRGELGIGLDWGWRKPGSIISFQALQAPSCLPLPKLVSPDLLGVLVDDGKLAHLQGLVGRTGESPASNEWLVLQPALGKFKGHHQCPSHHCKLMLSLCLASQPLHNLWTGGETQEQQETRDLRDSVSPSSRAVWPGPEVWIFRRL